MASTPPLACSNGSGLSTSLEEHVDPRVEPTVSSINWGALAAVAIAAYGSETRSAFHWGEQIDDASNLIRFLHLHNVSGTILVVRVPLLQVEYPGLDFGYPHDPEIVANKITSEVASMQYVEKFTSVLVPHVYGYSSLPDPDIGSPYIVMSKAEGVNLRTVWDNMDDNQRRIVLSQVLDIMLELWTHRFQTEGCLFRRDNSDGRPGDSQESWYTQPTSVLYSDKSSPESQAGSESHPTAAAYWLAYANARLEVIQNIDFGYDESSMEYTQAWFLRSLIPVLFDTSLDEHGYPLTHGEFDSQNIMVIDAESSSPRITCVLDWEMTAATYSSTFAQYPIFILDHPIWPDDACREQNARDQVVFKELLEEKERSRSSTDFSTLSHALLKWKLVYVFHQVMEDPTWFIEPFDYLLSYILGDDGKPGNHWYYTDDSYAGYFAKLREGVLKDIIQRLEHEKIVAAEARAVLGVAIRNRGLKRAKFRHTIAQNIDMFDRTGVVYQWYTNKIRT